MERHRPKPRRPIDIGNIIRNAVVFDFKNWREGRMSSEPLLETVGRLFDLLEYRGIDYLLVGGVALLQYVEGRNTEDVDLIMAVSSLNRLPEIKIVGREGFFVRGDFHGLQIDLLLSENPLFEKVRRRYASKQRFGERQIPSATVEGLLILKLYALPSLYRQGNYARVGLYENDIATLLQAYRPPVEPLFAEIAPHLSENDLGSLRQIVAEIEQRIARFEKAADESSSP
jgi:hypothetical protein